jgi:hypothetical protein
MPWVAHRRRGSKFGRNPVGFFSVPSILLPLALRSSSFYHSPALTPSPFAPARTHLPSSTLSPGLFLCL